MSETEIKTVTLKQGKVGNQNTHFKADEDFCFGTLYIPNEFVDPEVDEYEFQITVKKQAEE